MRLRLSTNILMQQFCRLYIAKHFVCLDLCSQCIPLIFVGRTAFHSVQTSTFVFGNGRISTHADLRPHATRFHERRIYSVMTITVALPTLNFTSGSVADSSDFWLPGE